MAKFAVMINSYTDKAHTSSAANGFQYALDLDENGHEAKVFFDGAATAWPGVVNNNPDHPVRKYFDEAQERGDIIGGACEYCANAYDAVEDLEEMGIPLLGGATMGHGPDVGDLYDDGYEIITQG